MQYDLLRVGEELVIEGSIRLTILAVEGDMVFLGIADRSDYGPVVCLGPRRTAVPVPLPSDN